MHVQVENWLATSGPNDASLSQRLSEQQITSEQDHLGKSICVLAQPQGLRQHKCMRQCILTAALGSALTGAMDRQLTVHPQVKPTCSRICTESASTGWICSLGTTGFAVRGPVCQQQHEQTSIGRLLPHQQAIKELLSFLPVLLELCSAGTSQPNCLQKPFSRTSLAVQLQPGGA